MWNPGPSESNLVSTAWRIIMKFDTKVFTKIFENERISWKSVYESHILLREYTKYCRTSQISGPIYVKFSEVDLNTV